MKLCLGYIAKNERYFLKKLLPPMVKSFDGIVAVVDSTSTDSTVKYLRHYNANIMMRDWDNNFSNARNALIKLAEASGYDAICMLDGDEALFPWQIDKIRENFLATPSVLIKLPRVEFCVDFEHYDPTFYPDYQGRVFKLNEGLEFRNQVHEMIYRQGSELSAFQEDLGVALDDCPIYHYGKCRSIEFIWKKVNRYNQITGGLEIKDETPDDYTLDNGIYWNQLVVFEGEHPLKGMEK